MDPNEREWDALAGDILWKISGYLDTEPDIRRFRSVCRRWRSSTLPLPPKTTPVLRLPCFNPTPGGFHGKNSHCTLTESTVYRIEPLHRQRITTGDSPCWVVRVRFSESGAVVFKNLGSPKPLKTGLLPKVLDLRDYKVSEIGKAYSLMFVDRRGKSSYDRDVKVAVSSCFSEIGVGFVVMALKKKDNLLGIWSIGDDRWNFNVGAALRVAPRMCLRSIAYHNGKFYAVDDDGGTSTFDPVSLEIRHLVVPQVLFSLEDKHLVPAFGDLYLVACSCSGPDFLQLMSIGFKVRKLDEQRGRWVKVEDVLNQCLLFVTPDWLAMVSSKDFPCHEGNCVYYVHHASIASGCDHLLSSSLVPDPARVRILCGHPCCSKLFWPPPTWLRKNTFISRMDISSCCPSWRAILLIFLIVRALWLWLGHDEDYFTRFLSRSLLGYHIPLEFIEVFKHLFLGFAIHHSSVYLTCWWMARRFPGH